MYLVGKWRKWRIWLPSISLVTHVSLTMGTLEREFHLDDASLGWNISDIFWHIIDRIFALLFLFIILLWLHMSNLNNIMKIDSWVRRGVLGPFSKGLVHRDRPIPRRTFVTSSSSLSQSSFCQSSLQQDSSYHTSLPSCRGLLVLELLTLVFYAGDPCIGVLYIMVL